MKYLGHEISDMTDWVLIAAHKSILDAEAARNEAASHPKFNDDKKKLVFPTNPNPVFMQIKTEIENELIKRKLQ